MRTAIPLPVPSKRAPWNSPPHRPEAPSEAERGLGHSGSASAAGSETRSRLVQPSDRQEAPRLRSRPFAGRRRMRRRQDAGSWHRNPKKTGRPVQFEITERTRASIRDWLAKVELWNGRYLFPSRFRARPHLSTRQYARIVRAWVESAGLDGSAYSTHSMRRTKAAQILPKLRAFIEHVKYRSADAPRDGTAARKLRKINIVNS